MSGEVKRDLLKVVENYIQRLSSINNSNPKTAQALLSNLRGMSSNVNELWKGLPSLGFGGFYNGKWQAPTKLTQAQYVPGTTITPDQTQSAFNQASQQAIEISMTALGLTPNTNLPQLLRQYSTSSMPMQQFNTMEEATATTNNMGFATLGLNLPSLMQAPSAEIQNTFDDATQQAQKIMFGAMGIPDSTQAKTTSSWTVVDNMLDKTSRKEQDMQELFGTEGRFESAFDLSAIKEGFSGQQIEMMGNDIASRPGAMLSLDEQKTLAAYALYSAPKFYIPPMLVVNDEEAFQQLGGTEGGSKSLKCFIFLSIGHLTITDATYPRNVPILKVPDADIDAVQDLGFGSGTIKITGTLWGEAGYVRLQSLRELCKTRRPLIWSAQETGAWLVFPQNVPGLDTAANAPGQYSFELTLVCVGKLTNNASVQAINKQRIKLVERKFKQEQAILTNSKSQFKLMSSLADWGYEYQLGYVWDPAVGGYRQRAVGDDLDVGEFYPDPDFTQKTTGVGSDIVTEEQQEEKRQWTKRQQARKREVALPTSPTSQPVTEKFGFMDPKLREEELRRMAHYRLSEGVPGVNLPLPASPNTTQATSILNVLRTSLQLDEPIDYDYRNLFGNDRTLQEASPSEIYFWLENLEFLLSDNSYTQKYPLSSLEISVAQQLVGELFVELDKRALPNRAVAKTPSAIYANTALDNEYDAKKLNSYYHNNYVLAIKQDIHPSLSAQKARFSVGIANNVLPMPLNYAPSSSENIKTTTQNNTWVPRKTKTLKRVDE